LSDLHLGSGAPGTAPAVARADPAPGAHPPPRREVARRLQSGSTRAPMSGDAAARPTLQRSGGSRMSTSTRILLAVAAAALAPRASALQPLDAFLRASRGGSPDLAEAQASSRQAGSEAGVALGRALPRLSLGASYTRNEYQTSFSLPGGQNVTITPRSQWNGNATLQVPLVDLASFARIAAARSVARAAASQEASTGLRVESQVVQDYYQLVANQALAGAAQRALDVAEAGLRVTQQKHDAGTAPLIEVDRARAEVERDRQQISATELQIAVVARALLSTSGLAPELGGEVALADDLHEERPEETFQVPDAQLPSLEAAAQARIASERQARAQRFTLVPSLSANLTQQWTDFSGLTGHERYWTATAALTWSFDLTTLSAIRAQDAAADAARAREQRARLAARDDIHRTWMSVHTSIARSRSARVEAEVSDRAARLAQDRYTAGTAAQLDLLQAQRDAFAAAAARIQADADVVNSRAQLKLAAGQSLAGRPTDGGTP
jgi:outer membrane protein TolC